MANPEHLEILKQGVEVWNEWRRANSDIRPDLFDAHIYINNLSGVDLRKANLYCAVLAHCDLTNADLSFSTLVRATLSHAHLGNAILKGASLGGADLSFSDLKGANLEHSDLENVNFECSDLEQAILVEAALGETFFARTSLMGADFSRATMGITNHASIFASRGRRTIMLDVDLREVKGLESVRHHGPTEVCLSTIYKSNGEIPIAFLRGCGVPEDFITYMRSLTVQPIQFYKSFISYSSKDQKFADRLYTDLQNKGVRCWLASEDLKIGAKIRTGIDEAIRLHDKLLLVLSKYSVASDWVEQEVETALDRERNEKRTVLFPIRLDDTVMKIDTGWPALIKNTRNIGDFRKWKIHDSYQKAFDRLLRDLKAEEKKA